MQPCNFKQGDTGLDLQSILEASHCGPSPVGLTSGSWSLMRLCCYVQSKVSVPFPYKHEYMGNSRVTVLQDWQVVQLCLPSA